MNIQDSRLLPTVERICRVLILWSLMAPLSLVLAGSWQPLANPAPAAVGPMLLLSDGTVMAHNRGSNWWYRLTPDNQGHYLKGTWSNLRPMHDTRTYFSSVVLRDGRVFVAGGEYGTGTNTAEVYDPTTDGWTSAPVPLSLMDPSQNDAFLDSGSVVLANGNVLISPVLPAASGETLIYNPASNTFLQGPSLAYGLYDTDEASWVKLPDDSILSFDKNQHSQRYIPSLNLWIPDADLPVQMYDPGDTETGPGFLLPDGTAFFLGGLGHTAIYSPSGGTNAGSWAQGPDISDGMVSQDAPSAMMANGKILCACITHTSNIGMYFYEYDPVTKSFGRVTGPTGPSDQSKSDGSTMLDLPDGTVLFSHAGPDLYLYQPDPFPVAAGKPTVVGINQNGDGSYHLTGTLLNGISAGAAFGDDAQMDSNYPLVRLTDPAGNVYYGRTYNWSRTSVMTGNAQVSTEFTLPNLLPVGTFSLQVVANGISSDPVPFTGPVWVQFGLADPGDGTYSRPFNTIAGGVNGVSAGGTIFIKSFGSTPETITITKPMSILALGGPATIGR